MKQGIIEIAGDEPLEESGEVIRVSFRTVAEEFGLTEEIDSTHPSFISDRRLEELREKGLIFFGYYLTGKQVGFVAVEKADDSLYYMEKLAVLPEYRHRGCGLDLVKHAVDCARSRGGNTLSISILNENKVLKDWYRNIGFTETSVETFPHHSFTVCYMKIDL